MSGPCKDCQSREIGCHASCEKYQRFTEERKREREWLWEMNRVCLMNPRIRYKKNMGKYVQIGGRRR